MRKIYLLSAILSCFTVISVLAQQPPTITRFTPNGVSIGTVINIFGNAFTGATSVSFGGVPAYGFTVVNDTVITAQVGVGASGNIEITTPGGMVSASGFRFLSNLSVSSFAPYAGAEGSTVTINGNGFSEILNENEVTLGNVPAAVQSATRTSLSVIVPNGTSTNFIQVKVGSSTARSNNQYIVLGPGQVTTSVFAFEQVKYFPTVGSPNAIAAGDFDGDGKVDLAITGQATNALAVIKNKSIVDSLEFVQEVEYTLPGIAKGISAGDVDQDGKPDVVVITANGSQYNVSIFRNTSSNQTISFAGPLNLVNNAPGNKVVLGDIDGDGLKEVIVANSGSCSVFRNTSSPGNISFAPLLGINTGNYVPCIAITDFDGDNLPDFVLGGYDGSGAGAISIYRNLSTVGNIAFDAPINITADGEISAIACKDLDLDGKQDFVVVSGSTKEVLTFNNTSMNGVLSFVQGVRRPFTREAWNLAIADFDMDGRPDLALPQFFIENSLALFRNMGVAGDNAFSIQQFVLGGAYPLDIVVPDITGDGQPDVVMINTNSLGYFMVLRNITHEPLIKSFTPVTGSVGTGITITGNSFSNVTDVTIGGVAVDSFKVVNDTSLVAYAGANNSGIIAITNSFGTDKAAGFTVGVAPVITTVSPLSGAPGTVVSITGRNFSDIPGNNTVYFGAVKAPIVAATDSVLTVTVPVGVTHEPITVVSRHLSVVWYSPFVTTFPGGGNLNIQSFESRKVFPTGRDPHHIAVGDIDNDGKPDVVLLDFSEEITSVYRNISAEGAIALANKIDLPIFANAYQVLLADLDGDGKKDIISVGNGIVVHQNTSVPGTVSFRPRQHYLGGSNSRSVQVADINGDGLLDLLVADYNANIVKVLRNTSIEGVIQLEDRITISAGVRPDHIVVNDFNNDGKMDFAFGSTGENRIYVFKNTSSLDTFSFSTPLKMIATQVGLRDVNVGDIDGDHKADILVGRLSGNGVIAAYRNTSSSDSIFFDQVDLSVGLDIWSIELSDLNGDASPDIILSEAWDSIAVHENTIQDGVIGLGRKVRFATGAGGSMFATAGDIDGDGKPDLLAVSYNNNTFSILRNRMAEALVVPSGAHPVTGGITNKVTVDSTVQTYQGHPYVQRHYDVTPINDPATATATITLYFSQQEFDNYNAHPAHGLDLPHHGADDFNKANLRVYQYHGFSTTSLPGSYSGNGVEIDPEDTKIVWNATTGQWEVTFDVNGFSGFFISSAGNSLLPVTFLSFTGQARDQSVKLQWTTTSELNVAHFEVQRRDNSSGYVTIGKVAPAGTDGLTNNYSYTDELGGAPVYYYRLKVVDIDESATYSKTIMVKPAAGQSLITLGPNPASSYVVVKHPASPTARLRITDLSGRLFKTVAVANNSLQTRVHLNGLAKGTYSLVWEDGALSQSLVLVVQ